MQKQSQGIILAELTDLKRMLKAIINPMMFQENWNGAVQCMDAIKSADRLIVMVGSLKCEGE